ncbi:MAG: alpha amylase C-terminal domain-containing protein, partial [Clostridia bacterium]|nr:alpha amylase C-terminal domain-containing protein [Clostridia bacterium]
SWDGFEWLAPDDADRNIVSFIRRDKAGNEVIALVCFAGTDMTDYMLGVNQKGKYKVVFNTDDIKYGGEGKFTKKTISTVKTPTHGKPYSLPVSMPKLSCMYLVLEPEKEKTPKVTASKKDSTAANRKR